jgi:excisionase family DNA binding protein
VGPRLLTTNEAADVMRCSERKVRGLIYAGALRVFRSGTKIVRVHRASLDQYIAACSSGGQAA